MRLCKVARFCAFCTFLRFFFGAFRCVFPAKMVCRKVQICAELCKKTQKALLCNTPFSYTPYCVSAITCDVFARHFSVAPQHSQSWKSPTLGVVFPHLPGEIFRAIQSILVKCSRFFLVLLEDLVNFHQISLNFSQLQSISVNFSQFQSIVD